MTALATQLTRIITNEEPLPEEFLGAEYLYLDYETTSGDSKRVSTNPWHNCYILGACITADSIPYAAYIPMGHRIPSNTNGSTKLDSRNYDWRVAFDYLRKVVSTAKYWVNHNVKYDAHVHLNNLYSDPSYKFEQKIPYLIDTLTLSKILDSDRVYKGGYGLDVLSKAWLKHDISKYEETLKRCLGNSKDYGHVPISVMGEYGCWDALTVRNLYLFLKENLYETKVIQIEQDLTRILLDIENTGVKVDVEELHRKEKEIDLELLRYMVEIKNLTGVVMEPHNSNQCHDLLCNKLGLPVLEWNTKQKGRKVIRTSPNFSKDSLKKYKSIEGGKHSKLIDLMLDYRESNTLRNLFVKSFLEYNIDCVLHTDFNQCVRTGRMSAKEPNSMQMSKRAKELIHPRKGNIFLSIDYSQIEFRLVVHYIQNEKAIKAYKEDPNTDFHEWVADICGTARSPAKTVNFASAYGVGKTHLLEILTGSLEGGSTKQQAEQVYNKYHAEFPEVKRVSKAVEMKCRRQGYVTNLYGRRRYLPSSHAHIAFNTINQSSAADLMKEAVVKCWNYLYLRKLPIKIILLIHDDIVFEGPEDILKDEQFVNDIVSIMEHPSIEHKLRVPIRVDLNYCSNNLGESDD